MVESGDRDEVMRRLGLVPGGVWISEDDATASTRAPGPSVWREPIGGWVLVADPFFALTTEDEALAAASRGTRLVAAQIEEHAMISSATLFADGEQIWQVICNVEDRTTATGDVPAAFAGLHAAALREENGVANLDAQIDVPLDLAEAICGISPRYLRDDIEDAGFQVVGRAPSTPQRPTRRRWFGRG